MSYFRVGSVAACKLNSRKFATFRGFAGKLASPGMFIADSSALARVLVGWVYLLSSSFSFPELLVGFPRPTLRSCPDSPECLGEEFLTGWTATLLT